MCKANCVGQARQKNCVHTIPGQSLSAKNRYFMIITNETYSLSVFVGYKVYAFDNCFQSFLNKIHSPAPKTSLAPKKILYFCLLFTGQHSLQIRTQISKLCSGTFPHIKLRFVFRPSLRSAHFSPVRTGFPRVWNPVWFMVLSVNGVVRCISAKPAVFCTHVFQTS